MSKKCLVENCQNDAAFSCQCSGKPVFMCTSHPSVHLLEKGNHQIISLLFKPNQEDADDLNYFLALALIKIKSIMDESLKVTQKIIQKTIEANDKFIKYFEI